MILGRNTQQWMGLITSVIGFVAFVIQIVAPDKAGPAGLILSGLTGVIGIFISFIANTYTTPTSSPILVDGTMVKITDKTGREIDHKAITSSPQAEKTLDRMEENDEGVA